MSLDPIWNNEALGIFWRWLPQQEEQQQQYE